MFDQDTKPEKVYTGIRASNTNETLKPRDIFEVSGDGRATYSAPQIPQEVWDSLKEAQDIAERATAASSVYTKVEKSLPKPVKKLELPEELPLTSRVENLESEVLRLTEQVDGLLDRIALHNTRSSHKI